MSHRRNARLALIRISNVFDGLGFAEATTKRPWRSMMASQCAIFPSHRSVFFTIKSSPIFLSVIALFNIMKLSKSILKDLANSKDNTIKLPTYLFKEHLSSSRLQPGILHIGVGNFHRAHLATYMDDLFHSGKSLEWAIVGAGITEFDTVKRTALQPQDWLTTLVERDDTTVQARVIGSMVDFLSVDPPMFTSLRERLLDLKIKVVSMTVTEGGYFLTSDGRFHDKHPDMVHDMQHPDAPTTVFGLIVQALQKRKESNHPPFTVLSCDNVPHNGNVCRNVVVSLARFMVNDELATWIDETVAFPNSMVDRITPATTNLEREYVQNNYGYMDAHPVFCEPYRQWVLEDNFPQGRPMWEDVGVQFVKDVSPYETMKIRILNGGHASLCYPAALLDLEYVHQAMEHPVIGPFLDALERTEIIPTVPPVSDGPSLTEYWETIQKRFSNPTLRDRIDRNCFDGANRQPKFILPPLAVNLLKEEEKGKANIDGLALICAFWCRYCQGTTESGKPIQLNDPQWQRLFKLAKQAGETPSAWLAMEDVYGEFLATNKTFQDAFHRALKFVMKEGVEAAMKKYTEEHK